MTLNQLIMQQDGATIEGLYHLLNDCTDKESKQKILNQIEMLENEIINARIRH